MIEKIKKIIPNLITSSRVIALIIGFILFLKGYWKISICLYIYGSVSDAFDGYLARKWDAYSKFGSYLDAISDKFYALSIIILSLINQNYLILLIAVLEMIITIINYKNLKKYKKVETVRVGKFKMTFEFLTLITALLSINIKKIYYLFIPLLVMTLYFGAQSINAYINKLNNKKGKAPIKDKEIGRASCRERVCL